MAQGETGDAGDRGRAVRAIVLGALLGLVLLSLSRRRGSVV
jgi:hypothetical protein